MRLGIDLDGVVADFDGEWIRRYNAEFGTALTLDAISHWDVYPEITRFADMDGFWDWLRGSDGPRIFRSLEPYDSAIAALRRLRANGHDIVVLTSRPDWAVSDTFAWIAEHSVPTREIHVLHAKWRVACDVYLDDAPHTLRQLRHQRTGALVCRFVRPWNEPLSEVGDIADWEAFEALVAAHNR